MSTGATLERALGNRIPAGMRSMKLVVPTDKVAPFWGVSCSGFAYAKQPER